MDLLRDEALLAETVRTATTLLNRDRDSVTLVGIEPDAADPDVGYIVPGDPIDGHTCRVTQFVEKPSAAAARDLISLGAVWNSFIFMAHAQTLLALTRGRMPQIVADMTAALAWHRHDDERSRANRRSARAYQTAGHWHRHYRDQTRAGFTRASEKGCRPHVDDQFGWR